MFRRLGGIFNYVCLRSRIRKNFTIENRNSYTYMGRKIAEFLLIVTYNRIERLGRVIVGAWYKASVLLFPLDH